MLVLKFTALFLFMCNEGKLVVTQRFSCDALRDDPKEVEEDYIACRYPNSFLNKSLKYNY